MRVLELRGETVGHWDVPLELRFGRRLTVILGDNEAGKSTLRRAIRALLFGAEKALVAPINVAAFHVTATLEHVGAVHQLERKGRSFQSPPPEILAPLLERSRSGRFADLFDLTHENVSPAAAEQFLKSEGAFGSLMFGAQTGVSPGQLLEARARLDEAIRNLDSGRKGNEGIPWCQQRYREAAERYRSLANFDASDASHSELKRHEARIGDLDGQMKAQEDRIRYLASLIEAEADVQELRNTEQAIEQLERAGSVLSVLEVAKLQAEFDKLQDKQKRQEAAHQALTEASLACDQAPTAGALHELSSACEKLREVVAGYVRDKKGYPGLVEQHATKQKALREVLERLGGAVETDMESVGRSQLRPEPMIAQLHYLLELHETLQTEREQAVKGQAEAQERLHRLGSEQEDSSAATVMALEAARRTLDDACQQEARIDALHAEKQQADAILLRLQQAMGFPRDSIEPQDFVVPSREVAQSAEDALGAARKSNEEAATRHVASRAEAERLERQLHERQQALGQVPAAEDLSWARAQRDEILGEMREVLSDPNLTPGSLPELVVRADDLGHAVRQADLLADGRMEAGEALGELRGLEAQMRHARCQCTEKEIAERAAREHLDETLQQHALVWPFLHGAPASVEVWFEQYEEWREVYGAQRTRESEIARLDASAMKLRSDADTLVRAVIPSFAELGTARAMHAAVNEELDAWKQRATRIETLQNERRTARSELELQTSALGRAEQALADWQIQWDASAVDLPEGLERSPAAVRAWLGLQESLRRVLTDADEAGQKLSQATEAMRVEQRQIEILVADARALAPELALPDGMDPADAFSRVDDACRRSIERLRLQQSLADERAKAERQASEADADLEKAHEMLTQAWIQTGLVAPPAREALDALSHQASEGQALRQRLDQLRARLRGRWGDHLEDSLTELQALGVPGLVRYQEEAKAELDRLKEDRENASRARHAAQATIDVMQSGQDATVVLQDLVDAREALLNKLEERHRLQSARLILEHAFGKANESGRLIEQEAAEYFRALTGGAWQGLRIDHGEGGESGADYPRLVAVESTRTEKLLSELSTGTRDQVWLALRLAGIVQAAKETPYPLLLDDSLVQFDDIRAEAALRLLHRTSEHVQVILFTHHDHLAALAQSALPAEDLAIVPLPEVSGAMRARAVRREPVRRVARPVLEGTADSESHEESAPQEGRRRRDGGAGLEEAKQQILDVLQGADAPMGKAAILEATDNAGVDLRADWSVAIRTLIDEDVVIQTGQKKGARYQLR